jgi:PAS domain S-box-containing protein
MKWRQLLRTRYFWYVVVTAVLAGFFSYAPQWITLFQFPIQADWQPAYYSAAYRLLFPASVLLAAWRFGVKAGLVVCLVIGPVILSSVFVNSWFPNAWIDLGDVALGFLLAGVIGKQGEMKRRLEETAAELRQQSTMLRMEIAERKQAEEEIERAAEQWQTTFDSITDWLFIVNKDFKLVRVNKAFAGMFGASPQDLIGEHCYRVVHKTSEPIPACPHKEILRTGTPVTAEYFEPGLGCYIDITISPVFNEKGDITGTVHIARDITERKRMQEQLMLTDRLASIGELASGIAHEINNPLTSIITFSQMLMERETPDDIKEDLTLINNEAKRTAGTIKNLLTFARKHPPMKQLTKIHDIIEDVLKLRAYNQELHNIQIHRKFATDLPEIMVDYFQMQQVFFNIIINAEYFMTQAHDGGNLSITTERQADFVRISFADDGPGIEKEALAMLFTPFFTTKEVGKGTGLGLSICHGIVAEHSGRIDVSSEPGEGTTFVIELPIGTS